jgi:hypothetical protein
MDYVYAFLAGLVGKIYDDISDNQLTTNLTLLESLKGSQWVLLTLLSHSDFNFALLFYGINIANLIGNPNGWDFPYEQSLTIICLFFIVISYHTASFLTMYDICVLIWFLTGMLIEPIIITEEYSYKKLISRTIIFIGLCCGLLFAAYFSVSLSIKKIIIYSIAYAITSITFQMYLLSRTTSTTTSPGSTG